MGLDCQRHFPDPARESIQLRWVRRLVSLGYPPIGQERSPCRFRTRRECAHARRAALVRAFGKNGRHDDLDWAGLRCL